jgi:hypothetical protein
MSSLQASLCSSGMGWVPKQVVVPPLSPRSPVEARAFYACSRLALCEVPHQEAKVARVSGLPCPLEAGAALRQVTVDALPDSSTISRSALLREHAVRRCQAHSY